MKWAQRNGKVVELKYWLSRKGLKTTGMKADLVERYMKGGFHHYSE